MSDGAGNGASGAGSMAPTDSSTTRRAFCTVSSRPGGRFGLLVRFGIRIRSHGGIGSVKLGDFQIDPLPEARHH
jgi:hypothetical protein